MKKKLAWFCAIVLCLVSVAYAQDAKEIASDEKLEIGTEYSADLTGDGSRQTVRLQYIGVADDPQLQVVVFGSDGGVNLYNTDIASLENAYITDLDDDGIKEILCSGSIYALDYVTYCLRFTESKGIRPLPFANIDRGGDMAGYTDYGYGLMELVSGGITLTGYQDILGTRMAARTFKLENEKMKLNDNGLWRFKISDETWNYGALTLIRRLSVIFDDNKEGNLEPGEVIILTASDLKTDVYFETRDGRTGMFKVEPNTENGWGSLIDGIDEVDYFEYLPYSN